MKLELVFQKICILQAGTAPESLQVIQHAKGCSYSFSAVQPGQSIPGQKVTVRDLHKHTYERKQHGWAGWLTALSDHFPVLLCPQLCHGGMSWIGLCISQTQSHPHSLVFVTNDVVISIKNAACSLRSQDEFAVLTAREIIS